MGDYDIDVVIDATARPRSREELTKHIEQGAKKVVLCTLPEDNPDATIVMGINEKTLKPSDQLIYNSSITTHCAAPIVGILDKAFGIERLCMTTIHAYTNAQSLADVPADDLRSSRAAGENIIPIDTVAGSILEQLFPHLENKIDALALNVPVPNGSLVDMTIFTQKAGHGGQYQRSGENSGCRYLSRPDRILHRSNRFLGCHHQSLLLYL